MWTPTSRQQHNRTVTRYQTDLTDAEWHVIAPHLPKPCTTGRPREWPMREIVNGIFYVCGRLPVADCCRRASHLGRRSTAGSHLARRGSVTAKPRLVMATANASAATRARVRRHRQPERQDHGGRWRARLRRGQKDTGRKRHAIVDTEAGRLVLEPHPATSKIATARCLAASLARRSFPFVQRASPTAHMPVKRSPRPR